MQTAQLSPELADAADVLSDQLRFHLHRLARFLEPQADKIDRRFLTRLREMGFEPQQRTALVLRYGHDLPVAEVADLLGVELATAKTHLVRGLARLRDLMEEYR